MSAVLRKGVDTRKKTDKMAFTHATSAAYPIFSCNALGCITGPVHCMRVPQISVGIFQSCQFFFCGFSSQFSLNHVLLKIPGMKVA